MKLPNFFIVGAAKAGTTSLYAYLSQHPDIYLSRLKEPKYLSLSANKLPHNGPGDTKVDESIIKSHEAYLNLFANALHEKVIGEASADYLFFHETAISEIKKLNPESNILIILRNPIDRAFSAYKHMVKDKRESLSFERALIHEEHRRNMNYEFIWFYKEAGFYYKQVRNYLHSFDKESVKICLYEDFAERPIDTMKDIFRFLKVDDSFMPNADVKHNVSQLHYNESFDEFLSTYDHPIKRLLRPILLESIGREATENLVNYLRDNNLVRLKSKTRKFLIDLYREDIFKLEELLNRDLSVWLE